LTVVKATLTPVGMILTAVKATLTPVGTIKL
jgi:hypothetical protein